ncbi:MAG: hypothetical protein JNM45_16015 [Rhizobiales bacterium]|nr:hypothetical protein [Hyphomicrobiales bacterium]
MKLTVTALVAALVVPLAFAASSEAAQSKAVRKVTSAQKQALMPRARAICLESKHRKGRRLMRADISDQGRLTCWYEG